MWSTLNCMMLSHISGKKKQIVVLIVLKEICVYKLMWSCACTCLLLVSLSCRLLHHQTDSHLVEFCRLLWRHCYPARRLYNRWDQLRSLLISTVPITVAAAAVAVVVTQWPVATPRTVCPLHTLMTQDWISSCSPQSWTMHTHVSITIIRSYCFMLCYILL